MFMEQILESFQKSRFLYSMLMAQFIITMKYFVSIKVFFKFIPNQISVSKDGIFLSYTYEYE